MPEITMDFSDEEKARMAAAAKEAGISVEEWVDRAARDEFRARYVLPKINGKVLTFQALKRDKR